MAYLVSPLGADAHGVQWGLWAVLRGHSFIPEIQTTGSGAVRADLEALVPYLAPEVRARWAETLEGHLDLARRITPIDREYALSIRAVASAAVDLLKGRVR